MAKGRPSLSQIFFRFLTLPSELARGEALLQELAIEVHRELAVEVRARALQPGACHSDPVGEHCHRELAIAAQEEKEKELT